MTKRGRIVLFSRGVNRPKEPRIDAQILEESTRYSAVVRFLPYIQSLFCHRRSAWSHTRPFSLTTEGRTGLQPSGSTTVTNKGWQGEFDVGMPLESLESKGRHIVPFLSPLQATIYSNLTCLIFVTAETICSRNFLIRKRLRIATMR